MKSDKAFVSLIACIILISSAGCVQKDVEGIVISVPMSMPLNQMTGQFEEMTFSGNVVKVRLENGEEIDAIATDEQMEQAFNGKRKATLSKERDKAHEGVVWKVIRLDEIP
jgi:hypothetical protein